MKTTHLQQLMRITYCKMFLRLSQLYEHCYNQLIMLQGMIGIGWVQSHTDSCSHVLEVRGWFSSWNFGGKHRLVHNQTYYTVAAIYSKQHFTGIDAIATKRLSHIPLRVLSTLKPFLPCVAISRTELYSRSHVFETKKRIIRYVARAAKVSVKTHEDAWSILVTS